MADGRNLETTGTSVEMETDTRPSGSEGWGYRARQFRPVEDDAPWYEKLDREIRRDEREDRDVSEQVRTETREHSAGGEAVTEEVTITERTERTEKHAEAEYVQGGMHVDEESHDVDVERTTTTDTVRTTETREEARDGEEEQEGGEDQAGEDGSARGPDAEDGEPSAGEKAAAVGLAAATVAAGIASELGNRAVDSEGEMTEEAEELARARAGGHEAQVEAVVEAYGDSMERVRPEAPESGDDADELDVGASAGASAASPFAFAKAAQGADRAQAGREGREGRAGRDDPQAADGEPGVRGEQAGRQDRDASGADGSPARTGRALPYTDDQIAEMEQAARMDDAAFEEHMEARMERAGRRSAK